MGGEPLPSTTGDAVDDDLDIFFYLLVHALHTHTTSLSLFAPFFSSVSLSLSLSLQLASKPMERILAHAHAHARSDVRTV